MVSAGEKGVQGGGERPRKLRQWGPKLRAWARLLGGTRTLHSTGAGHRGVGTNESNLVDLVMGIKGSA